MFAREDARVGQSLCEGQSFVTAIAPEFRSSTCDNCVVTPSALKRCAQCKVRRVYTGQPKPRTLLVYQWHVLVKMTLASILGRLLLFRVLSASSMGCAQALMFGHRKGSLSYQQQEHHFFPTPSHSGNHTLIISHLIRTCRTVLGPNRSRLCYSLSSSASFGLVKLPATIECPPPDRFKTSTSPSSIWQPMQVRGVLGIASFWEVFFNIEST
jgi:hypothetical protein